jgi:hypothetical protein
MSRRYCIKVRGRDVGEGPWTSRKAAQRFLNTEVGARGARVCVYSSRRNPAKAKAPRKTMEQIVMEKLAAGIKLKGAELFLYPDAEEKYAAWKASQTKSNPRAKPVAVVLAHGPNPDVGGDGYRNGAPYNTPRKVTVRASSFEAASKLCRDYLDKHQLGAGNWYGGQVLDRQLRVIAHVSYNGRVWAGAHWKPDAQEIQLKSNPRRRNPDIDWAAEALRQAKRLISEMGSYEALGHARARRALAHTSHDNKQWAAIELLIKEMTKR